jgi:hypothetical protein
MQLDRLHHILRFLHFSDNKNERGKTKTKLRGLGPRGNYTD